MTVRWHILVLAFSILLLATARPGIAMWLAATNIVIVLANWNMKGRWEW